jgi:hypothetical protein
MRLTEPDDADSDSEVQANRNSAFDRLDALAALDRAAPHHAINDYLAARAAYDGRTTERNATPLEIRADTSNSTFSFNQPVQTQNDILRRHRPRLKITRPRGTSAWA